MRLSFCFRLPEAGMESAQSVLRLMALLTSLVGGYVLSTSICGSLEMLSSLMVYGRLSTLLKSSSKLSSIFLFGINVFSSTRRRQGMTQAM